MTDTTTEQLTEAEALRYLTQCADDDGAHWFAGVRYPAAECRTCGGTNDAGHLRTPGSRYGSTAADCAPAAYRMAYLQAREAGDPVDRDYLNGAMSLVVNDHDDPEYVIRTGPNPIADHTN